MVREIRSPLYVERNCRFSLSGIIEIIRPIGDDMYTTWLDYGVGECDYEVTIFDESGNEVDITLGGRFRKK